MSTHSFIAHVHADGSFTDVAVTYDGYPEHMGAQVARRIADFGGHLAASALVDNAPAGGWSSLDTIPVAAAADPTAWGMANTSVGGRLDRATGEVERGRGPSQWWGYLIDPATETLHITRRASHPTDPAHAWKPVVSIPFADLAAVNWSTVRVDAMWPRPSSTPRRVLAPA